ncbi:MAG TPA: amidohydrolase family protein [Chthonomonadaceae bacterium]|nr:amidohydrolase family protein [Chthonomonadaceae bacterium]
MSEITIDGYCILGADREFDLTAEALLRDMDRSGVQQAVIAPVDRCLAVHNREGNAFLLQTAAAHPSRLIPACSVNPWYGEAAKEELKRALDAGARLLVLHPFIQGYLVNDELVWPLLEIVSEARVPVYIHTGMPGNATPWQIVDLAERFPDTDLIMGHCGATDFWNDVIEAGRAARNVTLEASFARPFAFARYAQALGPGRGIMGSFAPLNDLEFEWEQMRRVLPQSDWPDVYGGTLRGLLAKRGAR